MTATATWLPKAGDKVDRYEVIAEIARGGMAAVYAVRRRSFGGFGRLLAMKVLLPHLRDEQQFIDMFLDEARLASSVHHPNVVQVFDLGREQETPFLVMELVRGVSLSTIEKRVRKAGRSVPLGIGLHILGQAAEGLQAAHDTQGDDGQPLNIVHRDVSPHNLLVGFDGHTKVTDFGIAAGRGRISNTRSSEVRGKLSYLAPEQVKRLHALDRRVDVWGMGAVAFELFAGKKLFDGADEANVLYEIVSGEPVDLEKELPELPVEIRRILVKCLERERSSRLANCRELRDAFLEGARTHGCRGPEDVGEFVRELVEDVRLRIDKQLAVADVPEGASESATEPHTQTEAHTRTEVAVSSASTRPATSQGSRRTRVLAIALGGVGLIALAALVFRKQAAPEQPEKVAEAPVPSTAPAPAPSASVWGRDSKVPDTVFVAVADDVKLVILAGKPHTDRPLLIELGSDGTVDVELVSTSGKRMKRTLTKSDDNTTLSAAPKRSTGKPATLPKPLFESPYGK